MKAFQIIVPYFSLFGRNTSNSILYRLQIVTNLDNFQIGLPQCCLMWKNQYDFIAFFCVIAPNLFVKSRIKIIMFPNFTEKVVKLKSKQSTTKTIWVKWRHLHHTMRKNNMNFLYVDTNWMEDISACMLILTEWRIFLYVDSNWMEDISVCWY